jgi:hypothetical protein
MVLTKGNTKLGDCQGKFKGKLDNRHFLAPSYKRLALVFHGCLPDLII